VYRHCAVDFRHGDTKPSRGQTDAAPAKARPQHIASARRSAGHRPRRPAERLGSFRRREPFQVAQRNRQAILGGQPPDFFVKFGPNIQPAKAVALRRGSVLARSPLMDSTISGRHPYSQGRAISHAVEPARQQFPATDGSRFPQQHEKGGLEGVLYVKRISEQTPGYPEPQWSMSSYQSLESTLILPIQKALQELAVFQAPNLRPDREAAEVLENVGEHSVGHGPRTPRRRTRSLYTAPWVARAYTFSPRRRARSLDQSEAANHAAEHAVRAAL
jgi:hypothetical protein